jgi:hypothetical protein
MAKFLLSILLFVTEISVAQKAMRHFALINATAHIGNGKVIQTSIVIVKDDKIESVFEAKGFKINLSSFGKFIFKIYESSS